MQTVLENKLKNASARPMPLSLSLLPQLYEVSTVCVRRERRVFANCYQRDVAISDALCRRGKLRNRLNLGWFLPRVGRRSPRIVFMLRPRAPTVRHNRVRTRGRCGTSGCQFPREKIPKNISVFGEKYPKIRGS
jgi:hypothetical protein